MPLIRHILESLDISVGRLLMWYPDGQLSLQLVPYDWVLLSHVLGKKDPTGGLGSFGHVISGTVNNR